MRETVIAAIAVVAVGAGCSQPVASTAHETAVPTATEATPTEEAAGDLLSTGDLQMVLGPGKLVVELDETLVGAGLPPTCDHYEWDDRSVSPTTTVVHMVTPVEHRLAYETVTISDYRFESAEDAAQVMRARRGDFQRCETFVQRNLELGSGELVGVDAGDEAFVYAATADSTSTRGVTGVGGEQASAALEEPARVCWVQVRSGPRVVIIGVFGSQEEASLGDCGKLAGLVAAGTG